MAESAVLNHHAARLCAVALLPAIMRLEKNIGAILVHVRHADRFVRKPYKNAVTCALSLATMKL